MSGTGKIYEIRTVKDFFKVPAERRELCVSEFLMWMGMCDGAAALLGGLVDPVRTVFTWIDDDAGKVHVRIVAPDGQQLYPEPDKKG